MNEQTLPGGMVFDTDRADIILDAVMKTISDASKSHEHLATITSALAVALGVHIAMAPNRVTRRAIETDIARILKDARKHKHPQPAILIGPDGKQVS